MSILRYSKKLAAQGGVLMGGGGKGGSSGGSSGITTQANQYQNISPWASPYISSILGAAQGQVFQTQTTPGTAAVPAQYINGGYDANGNAVAGGAYDANGNPAQLVAGTGTAGTPASTSITGMNPYTAYGMNGAGMSPAALQAAQSSVAGFTPMQQQAFQGAANLQTPGQYGQATGLASTAGQGALSTTDAASTFGNLGAQAGQQGANQSYMYGQQGAQIGQQAAGQSNMLGGMAVGQGQQGAQIGQSLGQMSTNPGAVGAYMNPYIQNVLAPQQQLLNQQYGIAGTQAAGQATGSGAFGGSRNALQQNLNAQNQMLAQNQLSSSAYNTAYTNAQNQMNAATQAALTGNAQAQSGINAGLTAANQAGQLGLAGTQQGLTAANQYGQLGIAGANAGLAGVNAAQAGYNLAGQQASNLANIGTQQLAAQQGILGLQNQFGTQQQQQQQNVINQAMQNYATAQQYPMSQLTQLKNLISGLPMTDTTATQQNAAASPISQLAGLGTTGIAGLGMYNALNQSDIRTKENIELVGLLPNGLPLYEFDYKPEFKANAGYGRYRGVMAQDVENIAPEAVGIMENGYKGVNYNLIGIEMETV